MEKPNVRARFEIHETTVHRLADLPKVYICTSPKKEYLNLDLLINTILEIADCSVWYNLPLEQLGDMNLFIAPVTADFLKHPGIGDMEMHYAQENHIAILPIVEWAKENPEKFRQKYGNLSYISTYNVVNNDDEFFDNLSECLSSKLVSQELMSHILETVKLTNENTAGYSEVIGRGLAPEQQLFLGLAYLYGIGFRRNTERALAHMTTAAEAGLPAAMDKLADMYRDGEGVTADDFLARTWDEKLCTQCVNRWNEHHIPDDGYMAINCLRKSGNYLNKLSHITKAENCFFQMSTIAEDILRISDNEQSREVAYNAFADYAHILDYYHHYDKAKLYFEKAIQTKPYIQNENLTDKARRNWSRIYCEFGILLIYNQNDFSAAKECGEKALKIISQSNEQIITVYEEYGTLYNIYSLIGLACKKMGQYEEAKQNYEKAYNIIAKRSLFVVNDSIDETSATIQAYADFVNSKYLLDYKAKGIPLSITERKKMLLKEILFIRKFYLSSYYPKEQWECIREFIENDPFEECMARAASWK